MTSSSARFENVIEAIDLANAEDPRRESFNGSEVPTELLYSQRMTSSLATLYPDASEALKIAARAQHICRWRIPRDDYPAGRAGYNAWRRSCRELHATLASEIMTAHGYADADIAEVSKLIRKEELKTHRDSQRLENVVCLVFVEHYLSDFAAKHDDDKLVDIIRKTARKMDGEGMAAVAALDLPPAHVALIQRALA